MRAVLSVVLVGILVFGSFALAADPADSTWKLAQSCDKFPPSAAPVSVGEVGCISAAAERARIRLDPVHDAVAL